MKSQKAKFRAHIAIFAVCVVLAVLAVVPVYKRIAEAITNITQTFQSQVEERTGLQISYEKISPSILNAINIRGISVADASDGSEMLSVRTVSLRYDLLSLIKRDWQNLVSTIVINGVKVDFNAESDMNAVSRLMGFVANRNSGVVDETEPKEGEANAGNTSGNSAGESEKKVAFDPDVFTAQLPVNIILRNASLHFSNRDIKAEASVRRASFIYNEKTQALRTMFLARANVKLLHQNLNFSTSVSADGTLTDAFKNSLLLLRLSNLRTEQFSVGNINVLASYDNRNVILRSVQNFVPMSLVASYDIDSHVASVKVNAESLKPFAVINMRRKKSEIFERLADIDFTGALVASYGLDDGTFSYSSEGSIFVPPEILRNGAVTRYNIDGSREKINIHALDFYGSGCDVSFSGNYKFSTIQLAGSAFVRQALLPNGNSISADFYFTPLARGFECFSPEIQVGEKNLTAFELSLVPRGGSLDFHAAVSDYLHYESGSVGELSVDGSYMTEAKYFQSSVSVSSIYLDSAAQLAAVFMKKDSAKKALSFSENLSPYVASSDIYIAGDLQNVSYNIPYFFVANTKKENEAMLLSMDGTNALVRVSHLNLLYGGQSINVSGQADFNSDLSGGFFSVEAIAGTIPYQFAGSVFNGAVNVSGDYGFSLQASRAKDGAFDGLFIADSFPIPFSNALFELSANTTFSYDGVKDFAVSMPHIEILEPGNKFAFAPRVVFSGNISNYGAFFDSISYSDRYSSLEGNASLFVNEYEDIFSSAIFDLSLANMSSSESVTMTANISNASDKKINFKSDREDIVIDSQLVINRLGISRFIGKINDHSSMTATVTAMGTLDNPFVAVSIEELSGSASGHIFNAEGMATVENKMFFVHDFDFTYGNFSLSDLTTSISFETLEGSADANINALVMGRELAIPVHLDIFEVEKEEGAFIPRAGVALLSSKGIGGSLLKSEIPAEVAVIYGDGVAVVTSSENVGLSGWIDTGGNLLFSVPENYPLSFYASGIVGKGNIDIQIERINGDAEKCFSILSFDTFIVHGGTASGSFAIRGLLADPEFDGILFADDAEFSLPKVFSNTISVPVASMIMDNNTFTVSQTTGYIRNNPVAANLEIVLDRWRFDYVVVNAKTDRNVYVPTDLRIPSAVFSGEASADLIVYYDSEKIVNITGDVYARNAKGTINGAEIAGFWESAENSEESRRNIQADVRVILGERISIMFEPLLRCVFVPGGTLKIKVDQPAETYSVAGNVRIRSGEISWLSRNFYMRSGTLDFIETREGIDPLLNISAETRDRDALGRDIRITMSVENQYLSEFTPRFTAVPAKSEREIQELLGQIYTGDSSNVGDLFFSVGDYVIQSTVVRAFENSLRELLNFDIFSLRTNLVQNTLRQSIVGNINNTADWTIGNFFDNSTVYIGKYLNSDMFANALFHWRYDGARVDDETTLGGIIFQPEFGLELESPFVTIRWSAAPNIDALMNNAFVPSTSLTLSWKFSF